MGNVSSVAETLATTVTSITMLVNATAKMFQAFQNRFFWWQQSSEEKALPMKDEDKDASALQGAQKVEKAAEPEEPDKPDEFTQQNPGHMSETINYRGNHKNTPKDINISKDINIENDVSKNLGSGIGSTIINEIGDRDGCKVKYTNTSKLQWSSAPVVKS